ncbi:MAG: rhodanese-like domain-containing protein [Desulfatiglans sp.]|jgi:rhodanese-related sulfurtransferase|nr:rhodanese-like domain-containing protein [Thermodesulfobacteriota bacterium]MEE4352138.1 rhodanese-like domain-containing protein [Desulfatiglans sp.]
MGKHFFSKVKVVLTAAIITVTFVTTANIACAEKAREMTAIAFVIDAKMVVPEITILQAKEKIDSGEELVVIDVREPTEILKTGYLPNALLIPRGILEFMAEPKFPKKNVPIIVYCKTGGRSLLAGHTLKKMGYANVMSMSGGFQAWSMMEFPMNKMDLKALSGGR